jgi:hypothetical protein
MYMSVAWIHSFGVWLVLWWAGWTVWLDFLPLSLLSGLWLKKKKDKKKKTALGEERSGLFLFWLLGNNERSEALART